jgi:hypothetical protein
MPKAVFFLVLSRLSVAVFSVLLFAVCLLCVCCVFAVCLLCVCCVFAVRAVRAVCLLLCYVLNFWILYEWDLGQVTPISSYLLSVRNSKESKFKFHL